MFMLSFGTCVVSALDPWTLPRTTTTVTPWWTGGATASSAQSAAFKVLPYRGGLHNSDMLAPDSCNTARVSYTSKYTIEDDIDNHLGLDIKHPVLG